MAPAAPKKATGAKRKCPQNAEADTEEGVVYPQISKKGKSQKTVEGKLSARKHYTAFVETKKLKAVGQPSKSVYERYTEGQLVSEIMFREYGTFLAVHATKDNGQLLKPKSAVQYISALNMDLQDIYPHNDLWKGGMPWYTDVRAGMLDSIRKRMIINCEPFSERTDEISMEQFGDGVEGLIAKNEPWAIERVMAMGVNCKGSTRSGEGGLWSYNLMRWNPISECIHQEWQESKEAAQKKMAFCSSNDIMNTDFNFLFGLYWLAGGGGSSTSNMAYEKNKNLVLPFLGNNAADKVTLFLQDMGAETPGLTHHLTGKTFRISGTHILRMTPGAGDTIANEMGGWVVQETGISSMFHYASQSYDIVEVGARGLGGKTK